MKLIMLYNIWILFILILCKLQDGRRQVRCYKLYYGMSFSILFLFITSVWLITDAEMLTSVTKIIGGIFSLEDAKPQWKRPPHDRIIMCGMRKLPEEHLKAFNGRLCTHLVARTLRVDGMGKFTDYDKRTMEKFFTEMTDMRYKFPHLRTIVAIDYVVDKHHDLVNDTNRENFIETLVKLNKEYNMNGIQLQMHVPKVLDMIKIKRDKDNVHKFVKDLCARLWRDEQLLSFRFGHHTLDVMRNWDVRTFVESSDFVSMLIPTPPVLHLYFPLYGQSIHDLWSMDSEMRHILALGIPMNRVLMNLMVGARLQCMNFSKEPKIGESKTVKCNRKDANFSPKEFCNEIESHKDYKRYWDPIGNLYYYRRSGGTPEKGFNYIFAYETARTQILKTRISMKFGVRGFYSFPAYEDDIMGECATVLNTDHYLDVERDFQDLQRRVRLEKAIGHLNLPKGMKTKREDLEYAQYYINGKELGLALPTANRKNHSALHALNDAILMAQQEQAIVDRLDYRMIAQGTRMLWRDETMNLFPDDY